jgi:hypothetical protein
LRLGSYDGRDIYFQGIGASGFVTGSIKIAAPPESGGPALRYAAFMQGLRDAIDARINTETSRSVLSFYQSRKKAAAVESDQRRLPQLHAPGW